MTNIYQQTVGHMHQEFVDDSYHFRDDQISRSELQGHLEEIEAMDVSAENKSELKQLAEDIFEAAKSGLDHGEAQQLFDRYASHGVTLESLSGWNGDWAQAHTWKIGSNLLDGSVETRERLHVMSEFRQLSRGTDVTSDVITELNNALGEGDQRIREEAAKTLSFLARSRGSEESLQTLLSGLSSWTASKTHAAAQGIGQLSEDLIIENTEQLLEILDSTSDPQLQAHLCDALERTHGYEDSPKSYQVMREHVTPALIAAISSEDPIALQQVERTLCHFSQTPTEPFVPLLGSIAQKGSLSSLTAIKALGHCGAPAIPFLMGPLQTDSNKFVNTKAAYDALTEIGAEAPSEDTPESTYQALSEASHIMSHNLQSSTGWKKREFAHMQTEFELVYFGYSERPQHQLQSSLASSLELGHVDDAINDLEILERVARTHGYYHNDMAAFSNDFDHAVIQPALNSGYPKVEKQAIQMLGNIPTIPRGTEYLSSVVRRSDNPRHVGEALNSMGHLVDNFEPGSTERRTMARSVAALIYRVNGGDFSDNSQELLAQAERLRAQLA